jgi:hypothetical protein
MSRRLSLSAKDASTLLLSGLDSFLSALLRQVPQAGAPHPDADARLYPAPTQGQNPEVDGEWVQFVRPSLEEHFALNRGVMEADLSFLRACSDGSHEVEVPRAHSEAWIHALNQARLSLAAQFNIGSDEMDVAEAIPGEKGLAVFRIQFYGILQEWLLDAGFPQTEEES